MATEDVTFNTRHSANAQLYNDNKSAQTVNVIASRVLRTRPSLVPGQRYKLIVEGKGKFDIFVTQNTESFARQTKITLEKDTYDTHVYSIQLQDDMCMCMPDGRNNDACSKDSVCSKCSGNYNLVVEEENQPSSGHSRRLNVMENEPMKPWLILFNVEGNISLITITTEGGKNEDQLTFIDDREQSEHFSADKATFRRHIECTAVCLGNKLLKQNENVMLKVTRTESHGFCEIGAMSDEHFKRLTATNKSFGYRKVLQSLPEPFLRKNILHEPTTCQIVVTVPMVASGWPVFMFSGCTLALCSDIPSRSLSEETSLKESIKTPNEVGEQLQQVQKTLASLESKLNQKGKDDHLHQTNVLDQMKAVQREAEMQSTSLLELRDEQSEIMTHVKDTRKTVESTSGQVKKISTKLNKSQNKMTGRDDRSLEMLSKYIDPNNRRIKNALNEKEFTDYLLQYDVLTGPQHEDIISRNQGENRREKLMEMLRRKPVSHLPNVIEALQKSGNGHLIQYFTD